MVVRVEKKLGILREISKLKVGREMRRSKVEKLKIFREMCEEI